MAKRGAEKELTQNNWQENEDDTNSEGGSGDFKKASGTQLEGRKIRGLPKRKGAAAPTPSAPAPPKPSAFGGAFGTSSNPFAALSTPSTTPLSANTFGAFGTASNPLAEASKPASTSNGFSFGSSTSTATSGSTSGFSFGAAAIPSNPSPPTSTSSAPSQSSAEFKYYTSLRGLNVSLSDSLTKALDKDPFADLGTVLEKLKGKYDEHRAKIEKEFKGVQQSGSTSEAEKGKGMEIDGAKPAPPTIPAIFTTPPAVPEPKKEKEKEKEKAPAPPTAPAAFSFAGSTFKPSSTSTSASAPPATGGFVFKADAPADPYAEKSSFTFPPPAASSPASSPSTPNTPVTSSSNAQSAAAKKTSPITAPSAPKLAPAKLTNPPSKPSPLRFGQSVSPPSSPASNSTSNKPTEAEKPKSGFSFGATFGSIAKGDEGKVKDTKEEEEKQKEESTVLSEKKEKGTGKSAAAGGFSFTPSSSAAPSTGGGGGFTFGSSVSSSSTPAKSPFTFGGATPFSTPANSSTTSKPTAVPSPPIATSFGSASPPQFSFGAALQPKEKEKGSNLFGGGASSKTGFGFGSSIGGSSTSPSTSGFSFGQTPSSAAQTGTASMGTKPETVEDKKPVTTSGFSFGSTSTTAPAALSTGFSFGSTPSAASSTPFSFGAAASTTKPPTTAAAAEPTNSASSAPESSATTTPTPEPANQTPGGNPFAAPGAGEEGETVFHQVRGKVFKLQDGAHDLGIATISIKERENEEGKKKFRLLARHEVNGAVLINFALYPDFNPKVEKTFITFLGFDEEGKPVQYRLRVKLKEMVEELDTKLKEAVKQLQ